MNAGLSSSRLVRLRSCCCAWVLLLCVATPALAEQGDLFVFSTQDSVQLRWNAPLAAGYQGFHVERQLVGGPWQRLTAEPITRVTEVAEIRTILGPAANSFLTFFAPKLTSISDADFAKVASDPLARSMIQLFSVKYPSIGRVLGELYVDHNLQTGQAFNYRVILIAPGSVESIWAATATAVEHGKPDAVPVPQGLNGAAGDAMASLTWRHDAGLSQSGRLVGYRVWRSEKPFGPFEPASYDTVIPTEVNGKLPDFLLTDRFLENGRSYWYHLTGVNVLGFESAPSTSIEIKPRDLTPPPPPASLAGRLLGQHGLLEWTAVAAEDLAGFRVYRASQAEGPFTRLWPAADESLRSSRSYLDTELSEGSILWYYVTAEDTSGNESRPSDKVQIFRPDITPPEAPKDITAVAKDDGIHLRWTPNSESDLDGYMVQRTTRISGQDDNLKVSDPFFILHSGTLQATQFLDAVPATSQSRYAYRILAVDKAFNKSEPSKVVIARMKDEIAPTIPALVAVTLVDDHMLLRWQRSTEEDLAGYRIYRRQGEDGAFAALSDTLVPVTSNEFRDQPPQTGILYSYRITALDQSGNESVPSVELAVRYLDTHPPQPPSALALVANDNGYRVSWQLPPELDVDYLLLYRQEGDGASRLWSQLNGNQTDFLDDIAREDVAYQYYLRAVDKVGNRSDPSEIVSGVYTKPDGPD